MEFHGLALTTRLVAAAASQFPQTAAQTKSSNGMEFHGLALMTRLVAAAASHCKASVMQSTGGQRPAQMQTLSFTVILERKLRAADTETTQAERRRHCVRHLSQRQTVRRPMGIGANGRIPVYPGRSMQSVCN